MFSHSRNSKFYSLLTAALLVLFISCSQNTPEINTTDYSVIFDYEDEEKLPSARLSVFASSSTDVRRYQRVVITSTETGYVWDTEVIARIEENDEQWAGCTNIVAPADEKIPTGKYEITYYNADEKECQVTLDVRYDAELYDVLLPSLSEYMTMKHGIEKIAIYDKNHILIFFGDRTEELMTTRDIWNTFREAETYQIIWYSRNGNVICIAPEKPVVPEAE